jgi:hypothetical protein
MPLRRYHTPSFVRQTSSASIFPPLVSIITGLPPWRVPIPGPLVETGSPVARVCAVATFSGDGLGVGATDGDGDGETSGDGDAIVAGVGVTGWTVAGGSVAAEVFCD